MVRVMHAVLPSAGPPERPERPLRVQGGKRRRKDGLDDPRELSSLTTQHAPINTPA